MVHKMHPSAVAAAELIEEWRIIPNIDPRGRSLDEIIAIAEELRDVYGKGMTVVEILNRTRQRTALTVIPELAKRDFLPLLGTGVKGKHVHEAIEGGAVGYVSPGKNSKAIFAAIDREDGARLSIPTVTTPGEYYDVIDDKTDAFRVEYASELAPELHWNKVFPGKDRNLIQPEEAPGGRCAAEAYFRRMLGPAMEEDLNFKMLVTGHDHAQETLSWLKMDIVGQKPITVVIGPALSSPEEAYAWLEAICVAQPDSPWVKVLQEVRGQLKGVTRLPAYMRARPRRPSSNPSGGTARRVGRDPASLRRT